MPFVVKQITSQLMLGKTPSYNIVRDKLTQGQVYYPSLFLTHSLSLLPYGKELKSFSLIFSHSIDQFTA